MLAEYSDALKFKKILLTRWYVILKGIHINEDTLVQMATDLSLSLKGSMNTPYYLEFF